MRRRFRLFLWFWQNFFRKYRRLVISSLVFGSFFFFFGLRFSYLLPQTRKTIRVGVVGRYTTGNLPHWLLAKISRGLTKIEADGSIAPDLATSWEIVDNGKIYRFWIAANVFWQDGAILQASDIQYDLKNINYEVKDNRLLEFVLVEPFAPLPAVLAQPIFKKGLLGVGEYRVAGVEFSGDFIRSIRLTGPETLVFKFYPTEKAAVLGFKLGEVDELRQISDVSVFDNWPRLKIETKIDQNQFAALFFNTEHPVFSDKTLRQALLYALKKPEDATRALGPLQPQSWAYNQQVKPYLYNPERAKELLKEAEIEELKIELLTTFSQLPFADKVKESWQEVGLETAIRVVSSLPEDFQVLLAGQEIPADPDQYTVWHSTQETNITGYNSPKIDKLLEDGRKAFDQEERKAIYLDFQRFLVEDAPAGFLFHPTTYTVSR